MKIYTKTGDDGTTGLFAGPRVSKDDPRICAYGTVDELNACIGLVVAGLDVEIAKRLVGSATLQEHLLEMQANLFCMGAELATPNPDAQSMRMLNPAKIGRLESMIDSAESELPKLTNFILPGGTVTASHLHLARTVCRRAERELVGLMKIADVADYSLALQYLNRLADLLFVLARLVNLYQGHSEPAWKPDQMGSNT